MPDTTSRRRATQADVARLAGVDRSVVSAVVNGDRAKGRIGMSQQTRERVWNAVRELGYTPNVAARQLARGATNLIGVFTHERVFPMESQNFYHEFLIGIEHAVDEAGRNLVLFTSSRNEAGDRTIYTGGENSLQIADGAIIIGALRRPDELAKLSRDRFPYVFVGRRETPDLELDWVAANYVDGVAAIVTALAELGHQRIAWAGRIRQAEASHDRWTGFQTGIARHRATAIEIGPLDEGGDPIAELIASGATALLVESAWEADLARRQLRQAGIAAPDRMSLVNLSGASMKRASRVAHLVIPRREMGREAVDILLERIADPDQPPIQRTLDCQLDLRYTTGPAPA